MPNKELKEPFEKFKEVHNNTNTQLREVRKIMQLYE
jgi:hypothetical protein